MGSRSVLRVCRSPEVPSTASGLPAPDEALRYPAQLLRPGAGLDPDGRPFFSPELTAALLDGRATAEKAGLFAGVAAPGYCSTPNCFAVEPQGRPLVRDQYATVGRPPRPRFPRGRGARAGRHPDPAR